MTTAIDTTYDQLVERNGELMEEKAALVAELDAATDYASDQAAVLGVVAKALGVPDEPHQGRAESILEAAEALVAHVERLRADMLEASKGLGFAMRLSHPRETTAMQAVDREIGRLNKSAHQTPASSLARRDLLKQAEGTRKAALFIERKADTYDAEHGTTDTATGTREYPGDGAEHYNELMELADELRQQAEGGGVGDGNLAG